MEIPVPVSAFISGAEKPAETWAKVYKYECVVNGANENKLLVRKGSL